MIKLGEGSQEVTVIYDEEERYYLISTSKYMKVNEDSINGSVDYDETLIFYADKNGKTLVKDAIWSVSPGDHHGTINRLISGDLTKDDFDIDSKERPFKYYGLN